jgi:hypothetical protein
VKTSSGLSDLEPSSTAAIDNGLGMSSATASGDPLMRLDLVSSSVAAVDDPSITSSLMALDSVSSSVASEAMASPLVPRSADSSILRIFERRLSTLVGVCGLPRLVAAMVVSVLGGLKPEPTGY